MCVCVCVCIPICARVKYFQVFINIHLHTCT